MKRLRLFLANVGVHTRAMPCVTPPLGLMSLAAYLRQQMDLEIQIVNQRLDNCSCDELVRRAAALEPDVVGLSSLTTSAHLLPRLTESLHNAMPRARLVLGGAHVSALGAAALEATTADAAVPGEGEQAFEQILQVWFEGGSLDTVPGIFWRDGDAAVRQNPGVVPSVADLDSLPRPAYDLIDLPKYWREQPAAPVARHKYLSLMTSRGCPYGCIWCHKIFGKGLRVQSAERIVDDIACYERTYGIRSFEFMDDVFNFDPVRVIRFSELLAKRNLRIDFATLLRGDTITAEVADALVAAGANFLGFSLETGSPRLQKYIGKNLNIPRLLRAVELVAARRVYMFGYCMLGFPTETEEDLRQTIDTACAAPFHGASFFTVTPFPGTALYERVRQSHPEKLANLNYANADYAGMRVNLTDLPDEVLYGYQRQANRRFFLNPRRMARIVRDYPYPWALPRHVPMFLYRATKGLFR